MSLFQSFPKLKKQTNKELLIKFIQWDKTQFCCNVSCTVFLITSNFSSLFSASLGSYVLAYTSQPCISNFSTWFTLHEISLCKPSVSPADQEHAHAHIHMQVLGDYIYPLVKWGTNVCFTTQIWPGHAHSLLKNTEGKKKHTNLLNWHLKSAGFVVSMRYMFAYYYVLDENH